MNKKMYIAPAIKEVKINCSNMISTSVHGSGVDGAPTWGGNGAGKSADSRGGGIWDDEE